MYTVVVNTARIVEEEKKKEDAEMKEPKHESDGTIPAIVGNERVQIPWARTKLLQNTCSIDAIYR